MRTVGLGAAKVLATLIAVAPLVGSARVLSAASKLLGAGLLEADPPHPVRVLSATYGWISVGSVRQGREWVMDTITRQPWARANLVPRVALLDLLEASGQSAVTVVQAPPGYGKTTLLAQWADRDPRQFAWLAMTRQAAAWCERNGMPEAAVDYAMAAGDADWAARLVARFALPIYAAGRLSDCPHPLGVIMTARGIIPSGRCRQQSPYVPMRSAVRERACADRRPQEASGEHG